MKTLKTTFVAVLALLSISTSAQNLQLFYDIGRGCMTSTVEMFRPDGGGSTFFFIDFDYSPNAVGAYWEIARELNFWQNSKMDWLSIHVEYNGGLSNTTSFNNAFLGGLTYSGHSQDFTKTWSISAMYKAIPAPWMHKVKNKFTIFKLQVSGVSNLPKDGVHLVDLPISGAKTVRGKGQSISLSPNRSFG